MRTLRKKPKEYQAVCKKRTHKAFLVALGVLLAPLAAEASSWPQFWESLSHSDYIQSGHSGPVVYDFFDPNCIYCAESYKSELTSTQTGKLTVRYIPVGFLTPSSFGKAAAIMEAKDPVEALAMDMAGEVNGDTGGIAGIEPRPSVRDAIERNESLLRETGVDIVPDLVFRLPDGHVGMVRGVFPPFVLRDISLGRMP